MIFKRYGDMLHSVRPNFDANAMTEISFRRDKESTLTPAELESGYGLEEARELTASSEGYVKSVVEHAALHYLENQVLELEQAMGGHAILVVENATGPEAPKTRSSQRTIMEAGENRLHFTFTVEPPLRLGIHRRRG